MALAITLNTHRINQNNIERICLNKIILGGSTNRNYKDFGILPMRYIHKKKLLLRFQLNDLE